MPGDHANVDGANIYEPDDPDEPDEPDLLADAVRRAIRATRITQVPEADRAKAASLITDAAALLEADVFDGPHCQVGFDLAGTGFESGIAPHQYFAYSPVIGARNPLAPPVRFTVEPDKSIRGEVTLTEAYNGPPWNLAHGGVIAMIFDELLGVATIENHGGGLPVGSPSTITSPHQSSNPSCFGAGSIIKTSARPSPKAR